MCSAEAMSKQQCCKQKPADHYAKFIFFCVYRVKYYYYYTVNQKKKFIIVKS